VAEAVRPAASASSTIARPSSSPSPPRRRRCGAGARGWLGGLSESPPPSSTRSARATSPSSTPSTCRPAASPGSRPVSGAQGCPSPDRSGKVGAARRPRRRRPPDGPDSAHPPPRAWDVLEHHGRLRPALRHALWPGIPRGRARALRPRARLRPPDAEQRPALQCRGAVRLPRESPLALAAANRRGRALPRRARPARSPRARGGPPEAGTPEPLRSSPSA